MSDKKIFLVDDDPFWVAILQQLLEDLGYTNLHTFDGGNDCIANLNLNPDLIFLDKEMGDMDGLKVLEEIKNINPDIEVIFCTAVEDLSVAIEALRNGSNDFLLKSNVNKKEVSELLNNVFNQ